MKTFPVIAFLTAALASFATAQLPDLSSLPECGVQCLATTIISTGCDPTDFKCSCSNEAFVATSTACIKTCSEADQAKIIPVAIALCKSVGVDITPPETSSKASSSTPASSTVKTSSTVKPTDTVTSTPTVKSTASAETSGVVESSKTVHPSKTVSKPVSSATKSSAPIETSNDSNRMSAAMGFVGLGLVAAIAL